MMSNTRDAPPRMNARPILLAFAFVAPVWALLAALLIL